MEWPLHRSPVPDDETPVWTHFFLAACPVPSDPTMVWGTDVPVDGLESYLARINRGSDVVIMPAHVLLRAVGCALAKHADLNRRVLRRRLYRFKNVSVIMPIRDRRGHPDIALLRDVDRRSLADVAAELWRHIHRAASGEATHRLDERIFRRIPRPVRGLLFRLLLREVNWVNMPAAFWGYRLRCPAAFVSYLGHREAPPMRMYQPARFPVDTCTTSVIMGPTDRSGPTGPAAPLVVRADHRVVDAYGLGQFIATVRAYLADPGTMESVGTPNDSLSPGGSRRDHRSDGSRG